MQWPAERVSVVKVSDVDSSTAGELQRRRLGVTTEGVRVDFQVAVYSVETATTLTAALNRLPQQPEELLVELKARRLNDVTAVTAVGSPQVSINPGVTRAPTSAEGGSKAGAGRGASSTGRHPEAGGLHPVLLLVLLGVLGGAAYFGLRSFFEGRETTRQLKSMGGDEERQLAMAPIRRDSAVRVLPRRVFLGSYCH